MTTDESFQEWISKVKEEHVQIEISSDAFHYITLDSVPNLSNTDSFLVYQDWWLKKKDIIKSKIFSIIGISRKINGRQCVVSKISKHEADVFLDDNHIYGHTNSKVRLGLYFKNELFAVATFANQRQFKNGRSSELLRFCNKNGCSIVGGLGKLISFYIYHYKPDTIMTYIDLDWGKGNAFLKLGFQAVSYKNPIRFFIEKKEYIRISEKKFSDFQNIENYFEIKNRGSIKMVKKIYFNDFSS